MKILVTGGTGFIGSHLCEALLANGAEVVALGRDTSKLNDRTRRLLVNPKFHVVQHDITHSLEFAADAIYNLASPASPMQHQNDPLQTLKTNLLGTLNVLDLARKLHVPAFQASTGEVYGDPEISPQSEEYWGNVDPVDARACYTEGKRIAETLFATYQRQYEFPVRIGRLFSSYGPGMKSDNGRVISTFITQALRDEPITIFGDGAQTRSFCFIGDIVSGIMSMMSKHGIGLLGPLNLGSSEEVSLLDLAKLIVVKTESRSKIEFIPQAQDNPRRLLPSVLRAKSELNWEPKINLSEGLDITIDSFREANS
jgi:UDP-glucuronate decarboxylase